jgi:hypothetical protein
MAMLCRHRTLHNDISPVIVQKYRTQINARESYVSGVFLSVLVQLLTSDNMMLSSIRGPVSYAFPHPRSGSKLVARGPHAFVSSPIRPGKYD